MKAKKSLGQNFLVDNNIIDKIISEVSASEKDLIIEIGPGMGALTKKLKEKKAFVLAYELDQDLKKVLKTIENEKVKVIYKDFLKANVRDDIKDISYQDLYLVGNLPYYITTPIIEHVIEENLDFKKFTIMVQKEVADRFCADVKSKNYGYITLVLKYYFNISKVADVSKYAFNPVPKVESTVLSFTKRINQPVIDEKVYFSFLKEAFRQKRKTLKNNVKGYNWDEIKEVLKKYNLSESVRAEEISEEVFIALSKCSKI